MSIARPALTDSEIIRRHPAMGAVAAFAATSVCLVADPLLGHRPALFVYLGALVLAGPMLDRAGVLIQAGVSALAWDFFFTQPRFTFRIDDREDIALLILFLIVTLAIARLAHLSREREAALHGEADRLRALHGISKTLSAEVPADATLTEALKTLGDAFDAETTLVIFEDERKPEAPVLLGFIPDKDRIESARWAALNRLPLNGHIEIPEEGRSQYLVLPGKKGAAVLHLRFRSEQPAEEDRSETLRIIARLFAMALEKR